MNIHVLRDVTTVNTLAAQYCEEQVGSAEGFCGKSGGLWSLLVAWFVTEDVVAHLPSGGGSKLGIHYLSLSATICAQSST